MIIILGILLANGQAWPHARLLFECERPSMFLKVPFTSAPPRDHADDYKPRNNAPLPCGNVNNEPSPNPKVFTVGQQIRFEWAETIDHSGYYVFQISSDNGQSWTTLAQYDDDQTDFPSKVLRSNPTTWHYYPSLAQDNFKVSLPANLTCDHCIIRFIQHMNTTQKSHDQSLDTDDYFSCADIKIVAPSVQLSSPLPPSALQTTENCSQSSQRSQEPMPGGAKFSSCAQISAQGPKGFSHQSHFWVVAIFLFPLWVSHRLRRQPARLFHLIRRPKN